MCGVCVGWVGVGGRLPPMAPCGGGVEPSAPRTARDGRLRDRGQRPGQESSISKSASAAPALFHILNACCTFSTVRRCCTPLPPAASTPPITRFDPLPRAYSAQIGAPASSAASHQISSPFTCTSCPHACDAASCMPRATSWLCLPPSDVRDSEELQYLVCQFGVRAACILRILSSCVVVPVRARPRPCRASVL